MNRLRYIPAILVSIAIAVLSLLERTQLQIITDLSDKTLHALAYVCLAICSLWALWRSYRPGVRSTLIAWFYTVAYGALIEILQSTCTQTRTGDWLDLLADAIGAFVGCTLTYILITLIDHRHKCQTN